MDDKWLNKATHRPSEPRSPIKRYEVSTSGKSGLKSTIKQQWGFVNQKQMFNFVWETREHKCQITGVGLDSVPESKYVWMFAHILAKGRYTYYRLNPQNILLVHPDVHVLVDNFTQDMWEKYPEIDFNKWFEIRFKMEEEYKIFLKENML
jgi:hypothetical protein